MPPPDSLFAVALYGADWRPVHIQVRQAVKFQMLENRHRQQRRPGGIRGGV